MPFVHTLGKESKTAMKKITIITGHYGSGKTNLAVNLALSLADAGGKSHGGGF